MGKGAMSKMFSALDRSSGRFWILLVLGVALIERIVLVWLYQVIPYSDTPSYRRLAQAVAAGFSKYDGTRTPGYPLLLAVIGSDERVWLVQMLMGVTITFLLMYIGWQISGRIWFGSILALLHTLNPGQLFFEANLLSETATTFWLILTIAGMVYWIYRPQRQKLWLGIGIGVAVSMTWLTRPLFIYLPFWLLLFLIPWKRGEEWHVNKSALAGIVVFTVISLVVILGWVGFIHDRYHQWGLTTMTGYHMIQHTGEFFEYVPDQYADLRDTYLKYRDARIAQYGTQANTIWEAIPAMQEVSGKSFYDLSRLLVRISVDLIRQHPLLYMRNVIEGWWMFWRVPVYWSPEALRWEGLLPGLRLLIFIERLALFGFNLIFVVTSLLAAFWRKARSAWQVNAALWCILGTVWIGSILQTLMDHGDNPRFLVPMQSLVVLWVLWVCYQSLLNWTKSQPSGE